MKVYNVLYFDLQSKSLYLRRRLTFDFGIFGATKTIEFKQSPIKQNERKLQMKTRHNPWKFVFILVCRINQYYSVTDLLRRASVQLLETGPEEVNK